MRVPGITRSLKLLDKSNEPLSGNAPSYINDSLVLDGILGMDILTKFRVFELCSIGSQSMLRLSNGFIPVGKISSLTAQVAESISEPTIFRNTKPDIPLSNRFSSLDEFDISNSSLSSHTVQDPECKSNPSKGRKRGKTSKRVNNISNPNTTSSYEDVPNKYINFVLKPNKTYFSPLSHVFPDSQVEQGLENLHSLESIGIKDSQSSSYDEAEILSFEKGITFREGKYHVDIPWHNDIIKRVPSNYNLARVVSKKVSSRNGEQDSSYFEVFQEQLRLNIIEEITPDNPQDHIWIPHRPVIKTDPISGVVKIRPVFNCSLKTGGSPSLNEAAYPGTDLLNNLFGLINYFRTNDFVLLGDLAKAFLNIKLNKEEDMNKFSFVVYFNNKYHYYRYTTIIFGFIASPFILNFIIRHHANKVNNSYISSILRDKFYVDNLVLTGNNRSDLINIGESLSNTMTDAGFNLREWCSNDTSVLKAFDESGELSSNKFLGLAFDAANDRLGIKDLRLDDQCVTKRNVVSSVSSIFDPLGLVSPLLLEPKLFIRKLCQMKLAWDEKFSDDIRQEWQSYASRFNSLLLNHNLDFNRKVADQSLPVDYIVFTDASTKAYGFVMYALQEGSANLVFSKFKLAPQPPKTLPSLELLALYLAMHCVDTYISDKNNHLNISKFTFLTDSQIALSWILKGKVVKKNVFVSNRLKDIATYKSNLTKLNINYTFSYIPTDHNVADIVTKPLPIKKFLSEFQTWSNGPSWLLLDKNMWPKGQLGCLPAPFVASNLSESESFPIVMCLSEDVPFFQFDRFSSYPKLLACTIKFFEAVKRFQKKPFDRDELKKLSFVFLIKQIQLHCFSNEINYLKQVSTKLEDAPKLVVNLNLFIDKDGVLRSKGRMGKNLLLTYDAVNPILLGSKHHITNLIIKDAHVACSHMGVDSTMNFLRQTGFWVLKPRQSTGKVVSSCGVCKRYNTRSFAKPPSPALPSDRVNLIRAFSHTGIDFTGHFFVKDFSGQAHKVYILIFTCLNSRAIHLEMVNNMSVTDFVMAFVRFHNRFGLPKVLYSDNARSFISSSALLSTLISSDIFQKKFEKYNLIHKTIPTYSPWFGATWERLIKTVKQCFYKTFGRSCVGETEFLTTLSDIQIAINNLPLTYRDRDNLLEILTPNHLISNSPSFPTLIISEDNLNNEINDDNDLRENILNTLELRDVVISKFTKEFFENYLLSLRDKHRSSYGIDECKQSTYLKIGSVVLIKNPVKPRPYWSIGKIIELLPGDDNLVRVCRVLKPDHTITTTSISNLYPLELECEHTPPVSDELDSGPSEIVDSIPLDEPVSGHEDSIESPQVTSSQRPVRHAAQKFRENLSRWLKLDAI